MPNKLDLDVLALKRCVRALNQCSSRTMVKATLSYLNDRYLWHPSSLLPMHLQEAPLGKVTIETKGNDDA